MKPLDLRGQKFGSKKVIADAPSRNGKSRVYVRCDCGHFFDMYSNALKRSQSKSCPKCRYSLRTEKILFSMKEKEIGAVYGMRVIKGIHMRYGIGCMAEVKCQCGFESSVRLRDLKAGTSDACNACANATYRATHRPPKRMKCDDMQK